MSAGVSAYQGGNEPAATRLFKQPAGLGSPRGMTGLGVLLARRGETKQAEQLFRRAADLGNAKGMTGLGALLARQAQMRETESLFNEADYPGNAMRQVDDWHREEYPKAIAADEADKQTVRAEFDERPREYRS